MNYKFVSIRKEGGGGCDLFKIAFRNSPGEPEYYEKWLEKVHRRFPH
jgi:hypothetical protein